MKLNTEAAVADLDSLRPQTADSSRTGTRNGDAQLVSARVGRRSPSWALAYLRGRAAAYRRGSVTQANVNGCVHLVLRYGASLEAGRQVLADFDLAWDDQRHQVMRRS
jgi:hypothetical protein